jgi:glycerophosphoryl diester phosphodiesterase
MRRLLRAGVDSITTNRVDVLCAARANAAAPSPDRPEPRA